MALDYLVRRLPCPPICGTRSGAGGQVGICRIAHEEVSMARPQLPLPDRESGVYVAHGEIYEEVRELRNDVTRLQTQTEKLLEENKELKKSAKSAEIERLVMRILVGLIVLVVTPIASTFIA
ncbi:hypothetical protein ACLQ2H_14980 [Streptomyces globisporus]|uniref:hypothetical protein n=2 Tax=Streptomyces TaxID=1883 RepID=UPI003CE77218